MLYKFGMTDCRFVSTPLDRNLKLRPDLGAAYNEKRFWQIVGSLIYLTITRPDLSYPMGVIIQFMQRPIVENLQCALRVLRHVSITKDRGLLYRHGLAEQLVGYTDADWAGDASDRRPTSSFTFSLGSAVVARSSKKQPTNGSIKHRS